MKFSTRHDIEAPIDFVFQRATDFVGFERQALRRGIEVGRIDELTEKGPGMRWEASFLFRGKRRNIRAELQKLDEPNYFMIESMSGGTKADFDVEFLPLSRNRTRIKVGLQLVPKSVSSRLLIQSLKFAKKNLNARFAVRIQKFGADVEKRYGKSADQIV